MFILLAIFSVVIPCVIYRLDGYRIVRNTVVKKYRDFRRVNELVGMKYKTIGKICCVSVQLIGKMYWLNFLQWLNNSVQLTHNHLGKKTYVVSYSINGNLYRFPVHIRKGPSHILLVTDSNSEDVTDEILPYFGPHEDWHQHDFTPEFWGQESLTFELGNGESKNFAKNDKIKLI